jgi:hypothetical protein
MVFSERLRAAEISQRMASAWARSGADFDRHLVGRAADAAAADLDAWLDVVQASWKTPIGSRLARVSIVSKAP